MQVGNAEIVPLNFREKLNYAREYTQDLLKKIWPYVVVGVGLGAFIHGYSAHKPETTLWGIVISLLSISFMWYLIHQKMKVGTALNSPAILADAACSKACVYLSVVLMISSIGFE